MLALESTADVVGDPPASSSTLPLDESKQHVPAPEASHHAGMGISILNLVKNIVGTSMLSMSFGVACSGVVPSLVICTAFAILSGYTFGLLGVLCGEAKADSYRRVCEKYIGQKVGVWIDVLMAIYTFPACIAYSIFVCDCMRKMVVDLAPDVAGEFYTSRAFIGIILTVGILMPLCCLSSLESLTFTSILGNAAIIYCYVFVSHDLATTADSVDVSGNIANALWWPPSGSFIGLFPMANIYASCYVVQYNSPNFFSELKQPTSRRFYTLSYSANAIVAVFCGSFAILGFARFGLGTPDNLLVGYDKAYAVWVATCVSLITTYPFVFDAGRRSTMSAFRGNSRLSQKHIFWGCTFILIPICATIAIFVDSLSLVVGINGSLCGMTVGFTLPGYLLVKRSQVRGSKQGVYGGWTIVVFGILMTVLGMASIFIHVEPNNPE